MNINFFNKIKLLLGITYEDPIKDEEIKILIESAKLFLLNAGWHKKNIENSQSVIASIVYIKMAQNMDIANFINHPVITSLIMQNKEEQITDDMNGGIDTNLDNINLENIEKEIQKINSSLNLILNKIDNEVIIEKIEEIKEIINSNNISSNELITNIQNSINILQNFNQNDLQTLIADLQSFITNFLLEKNNELNEKLETVIEGMQTINQSILGLSNSGGQNSIIKVVRSYSFSGTPIINKDYEEVVHRIFYTEDPIENTGKTLVISNCYTLREKKQYTNTSSPYEMAQPVYVTVGSISIAFRTNVNARKEHDILDKPQNSYLYGDVQIVEFY